VISLSVCIEPFFSRLPYRERIEKVAALGFRTYEFWFHDKRFDGGALIDEQKSFDEIAELNAKHGLTTAGFVFNHPDGGVRASLIEAKDRSRLLDNIEGMIALAKKIGCRGLISGSGNQVPGLARAKALECMTESLSAVAKVCQKHGITIFLEPFNTRVDHPDYFLDDPRVCAEVLKAVNNPSAKMLFDFYHMQIMSGNILSFVKENIGLIGHFHVAAVPGRREPDAGELAYPFILKEVDAMGYTGHFGLEYWPTIEPGESLLRTRRALTGA
jgi:hydroxypyruvate isomerase